MSTRADFDTTFWVHHMRVGVWMSVCVIGMAVPYIALTPDGPHRPALLIALPVILLGTLGLLRLPWERLVQGRRGLVVFYSWSAVIIACIVGLSIADGGLDSPFAFTMVLPLIFATMAYPLRGLIGVTLGCIGGLLLVGVVSGAGVGAMVFIAALEVLGGVMGGLIADNHRRSHVRQVALQGELERLASVDGLTGCLNHRAFHEVLGVEVARARRTGTVLALAVLDLDEFKQINDTHGHPVGDEVLAAVGRRLQTAIDQDHLVGRTGGEEFAVLVPRTDIDVALGIAERLRSAIGQITEPLPITVSIGVSTLPGTAPDAPSLVQQADLALYRAKGEGRDRVVAYGGEETGRPQPTSTAGAVRSVMAEGAVTTVYQPLVDLTTGDVVGYEALTRIPGSHRSIPQWLQKADEEGLRYELERCMIDRALAGWHDGESYPLFLNVGIGAILSGALLGTIGTLAPGTVIELSETDEVPSFPRLLSALEEWRGAGIRIAIDDVGAGHSNLRHVTAIAPDVIKLDRALVTGIHADAGRRAMVGGLAGFARETGATLVAEGVETAEEAEALAAAGVAVGQGYFFARPAFPPPPVAWRPAGAPEAGLPVLSRA